MRLVSSFTSISVDGFFTDSRGDMSWAHGARDDAEWNAFVGGNARSGGMLLFGRKTYEMMAGYWPTPMALEQNRVVAERMNALPKVVFSRTMEAATWENTTLLRDDLVAEVRRMKGEEGPDIAILGSGSVVAQLAQAGLIDEFQIVVIPVIVGAGRTLFSGVEGRLPLHLLETRSFANGNVVLRYSPSAT